MHTELLRGGYQVFAVSESQNDTCVRVMLVSSFKESRPTMSYGINYDHEDEVSKGCCCAEVIDKG
ncbi:hypothetical protein D3C76_515660 [compost metagenome]